MFVMGFQRVFYLPFLRSPFVDNIFSVFAKRCLPASVSNAESLFFSQLFNTLAFIICRCKVRAHIVANRGKQIGRFDGGWQQSWGPGRMHKWLFCHFFFLHIFVSAIGYYMSCIYTFIYGDCKLN